MEKEHAPDVIRPEDAPQVGETNVPKRKASQEWVDKGIASLDANDVDGAIQALQNAINIDPTNGVAYYYLARATYDHEKPDAALGFLDKAEALIGRDEEWKEAIEALRHEIAGEGEPPLDDVVEENNGTPSTNTNGY